MSNNDLVSWRTLEREGCGYGRLMTERVERIETVALERVERSNKAAADLERKVDRLTWVLAGAGITFGTGALMLALNLLL